MSFKIKSYSFEVYEFDNENIPIFYRFKAFTDDITSITIRNMNKYNSLTLAHVIEHVKEKFKAHYLTTSIDVTGSNMYFLADVTDVLKVFKSGDLK